MEHPLFQEAMQNIKTAETDRKFCLHGYEHGLDVARICYIMNLEQGLEYKKDLIYAMALLHDIGRAKEYEDGSGHHEAGVELARTILNDAGFDASETEEICYAISKHKEPKSKAESALCDILFKADKLSRNCFDCAVYDACYWDEGLKNKDIRY